MDAQDRSCTTADTYDFNTLEKWSLVSFFVAYYVTLELVCRISRSRPRDFRLYCLVQICRMSHLGEAKHSLDSVLICRMSKQKSIQYRYPFLRTSLLFCFSALGLGLGKKSYSTSRAEQ
ncbi:hypothetical protein Zmor_010954 [Zophobas morio]|uniref:Uncharacterized protein n=1 Tax=Zophobas morio TaxID=2755281 RepID=A0AA38IQM0_9CUCU|nr:hypothetical protein Zmor_010954 [Zophobas morio]